MAKPKIYLSNKTKGLEKHRQAVAKTLRDHSYEVTDMMEPQAPGRRIQTLLAEGIDGSQVMVLLLGSLYGPPREGSTVSWTEEEWNRARKLPLYAILPFVHSGHFGTTDDPCELAQRDFINRAVDRGRTQPEFDLEKPEETGPIVLKQVALHFYVANDELRTALKNAGPAFEKRAVPLIALSVLAVVVYLAVVLFSWWYFKLAESEVIALSIVGCVAYAGLLAVLLLRAERTTFLGRKGD
jgi:hypothetical protein